MMMMMLETDIEFREQSAGNNCRCSSKSKMELVEAVEEENKDIKNATNVTSDLKINI